MNDLRLELRERRVRREAMTTGFIAGIVGGALAVALGIVIGASIVDAASGPGSQPPSPAARTGAPSPSTTSQPPSSEPVAGRRLDDVLPAGEPVSEPASLLDRVTREGIASTYGPGWDGWIASPWPRGTVLEICGPGGCETRMTNDVGPALYLQRQGRVVDLDVATFELVCEVSWRMGLCPVTVTVVG